MSGFMSVILQAVSNFVAVFGGDGEWPLNSDGKGISTRSVITSNLSDIVMSPQGQSLDRLDI